MGYLLYPKDSYAELGQIVKHLSLRPVFNKKKVLKIYLIIFTGPVGVAAAAAIASAKKRKHHYSFETNPSVRKRQQNRLLRKLRVSFHSFQNIMID